MVLFRDSKPRVHLNQTSSKVYTEKSTTKKIKKKVILLFTYYRSGSTFTGKSYANALTFLF